MSQADASIPYAGLTTKPPRASPRLWAGVMMGFVGLGLIVLSGCFLIGVLLIVGSSNLHISSSQDRDILQTFLYIFSSITFLAGLAVTILATRSLWHTING